MRGLVYGMVGGAVIAMFSLELALLLDDFSLEYVANNHAVGTPLIREPQLLLLDEAHAGLDADARGLVDHVIEDVRARNGAVVMVSHEADRMTGSATRIVQLAGGTIMAGEAG